MKIKVIGMNKAYYVEVRDLNGDVAVSCGNLMGGMTGVVITKEQWKKLKSLEITAKTEGDSSPSGMEKGIKNVR